MPKAHPDQPPAKVFAEELFASGRMPVSTHEEWLLRMCGQMMEREAHFVSVMEGKVRGSRLPCPPTKTSCTALGASTGTHMETEETSSLES